MKRATKTKDLVLLMRLSKASGREILGGVSSHARRMRGQWRLHVVNSDSPSAPEEFRRLLETGADCVIAHGLAKAFVQVLLGTDTPLVFIGQVTAPEVARSRPMAYVRADEETIARVGAEFLCTLGRFRSIGFATYWPNHARATSFREFFETRGMEVLPSPRPSEAEAFSQWLGALPRPAAIMAEDDATAIAALGVAQRLKIRVPREMAVLGVDDDEVVCETADPPLSSVAVDHEQLGGLAGEAARRLLEKNQTKPFTLLARVRGVVERQSTRPISPATALAERAASFIRRNATKGISAADVVAHLGVSRSLAALRFRQVYGQSMTDAVIEARLDAAARKLRNTSLSIAQVTASCGFRDADHARRLFRRRFGRSMGAWRRAQGAARVPEL